MILAPESDDESFNVDELHTWLAQVLASSRVELTRRYLTGISMGGQGVFDYLAKYGDEQKFVAAVPISGDYLPPRGSSVRQPGDNTAVGVRRRAR